MNLLNLLLLLIFISNTLGSPTLGYLNNANKNINSDEVENKNSTLDSKDSFHLKQHQISELPIRDSSKQYEEFQDYYTEINEEDENATSDNVNLNEEHSSPFSLNEETSEKFLLDRLFKEQYDFEEAHRRSKKKQTLMRRQLNNEEISEEYSDTNNIPFSLDASYLKTGSPQVQNADKSYTMEVEPRNVSNMGETEGYLAEPFQYFQKNYYYNYYPLMRGHSVPRTHIAVKNDEMLDSEGATHIEKIYEPKGHKKNPCKLYLDFLKYAFKELDQHSDYSDLNPDYIVGEADENQRVYATQLLGPALFIDNSGRVFQINSRGNSIQTVEGVTPSSKISPVLKDFINRQYTTLKPVEESGKEATNQPYINSYKITHDRPSAVININSDGRYEKEPPTIEPDREFIKTEPVTFFPDTAKNATTTETMVFITTSSPPKQFPEEYYLRSGFPWDDEYNSSDGASLYFQKENSSSPSSEKNIIQSDTVVSFDGSENNKKDVDCNDKTLPCPDTVNITYPLNGYCNRYVSCESGVAIRRTCPNGLHFNIITKSCDFPHNSICSYYCPESDGYYGIPGDCTGYFVCKNFTPEYRMCPPNMEWDTEKNSCTFTSLSSCPLKCSTSNEIKPYDGDCKAYIICLNGIPYYHKCPPNLIYYHEKQECISESRLECKDNPRLMTKALNPSSLCKSVNQKLGTMAWCKDYLLYGKSKP